MIINNLIVKRCVLSSFLFIFTMPSQAGVPSIVEPSIEQAQQASKIFAECVKSKEPIVISADHQICGVIAENRTQLLKYLSCIARRNFIYTRVLDRYDLIEVEYRCSDQISVGVTFERHGQQYVVAGIGYIMA
jgi:hypothetical protein